MKFLKAFLITLLVSAQAVAGFPPTTSKVSGDSTNVTTFNYQFPNFAGTHTGTTISLGILSAAGGGFGISTASSTGVPSVSSGTWSVNATLSTSLGGLGASFAASTGALSISSGTVSAGTLSIGNGGSGQITANAALNAFLPAQGSASGEFLKSDGTNTTWAAIPDGTYQAKSTTYTALSTDTTIGADTSGAGWTLALPAAASNTGHVYFVVLTGTGSNALTIDPNASETICGATTVKLLGQGDAIQVVSDGTNWQGLNGTCYTTRTVSFGTGGSLTSPAACSGSPCTIYDQGITWLTNVTRTGAGTYSLNILTGVFSLTPMCQGNVTSSANFTTPAFNSTRSATTMVVQDNTGSTGTNASNDITCRGPR